MIQIVDPETGEALGVGKEGEIRARMDNMMAGYVNRYLNYIVITCIALFLYVQPSQ